MKDYKNHLIQSGSTILQALVELNKLGKDAILFVTDNEDKLIGSLTDGDIRRSLIKGFVVKDEINDIIQPNPRFIRKGERDVNKIIEYRENNFKVIPILDKKDKVVNVINFRNIRSYLPVDVVVMAGGKGQRLQPLTNNTPKPLLKVGNRPILEHNINRLALYGMNDFWLTIKYLGKQIEDYFGNGQSRNIRIQYVRETEPLGTIGAVSLIEDFSHDYVLVTNSDILTNIDYEHFFLDFLCQDADFSVVTIPYQVNVPYGVLETNDGHVLSFKEKPTYTYYSNGGIYLMKRDVLERIPDAIFFNATDLMENLIKSGKKVRSYPLMGYWLDIGKHEDYQKAQKDIGHIKF